MKEVFDAWVINTRSVEGHGFIGRYWYAFELGGIPLNVAGCRLSMFETRKLARTYLPQVKRAFPKARVERVTVSVVSK